MRALKEQLETEVMMMDFGKDEEPVDECYITGGHVDLYTIIKRAGGVGSRWKYCPGQVAHCWLTDDGRFVMDDPGGDGIPITVVLEPDELIANPDGTFSVQRANAAESQPTNDSEEERHNPKETDLTSKPPVGVE